MKLYEIDAAISAALDGILNAVDPDTGEIMDSTDFEQLEELQAARDAKLESIGLYIKNLQSDADELKAEENRLHERLKEKERKAKRLTDYLSFSLLHADQQKFETPRIAVSFRKSAVVDVPDVKALPVEYIKEKTEYSADKTAIKAAIKAGKEVIGAQIIERQNIQIK